jgi:hypothetical protein
MPTDTFPIAADADDGHGRMQSASTWVNTPSGVYTDNPFGSTLASVAKHGALSVFYVVNAFFRFDTSSIDDAATITSANLLLYCDGAAAPDGAIADYGGDFYDFGGSPSTSTDWEWTTSGDAITTISAGSLSVGSVNTIALTGLSGISKTGITGIRLAPKDSANAPTADNFIDFAAREHTTGQEPRLEVTYSAAALTNEAALRTAHTPVTWRT